MEERYELQFNKKLVPIIEEDQEYLRYQTVPALQF